MDATVEVNVAGGVFWLIEERIALRRRSAAVSFGFMGGGDNDTNAFRLTLLGHPISQALLIGIPPAYRSGLGDQSISRDDPFNPLDFCSTSSSPHSRLKLLTREKPFDGFGELSDREVTRGGMGKWCFDLDGSKMKRKKRQMRN